MASVLLWIGIALTIIGWLAFARQAAKRMTTNDEMDKFPEKKNSALLKRNYCRLTIIAGILIMLIALAC